MKYSALILACTVSLLTSPARADVNISFDFFHDTLSPYGSWSQTDSYGLVWQPTGVDREWSPYTDGYWSYTDAGWTWVSYEDWGGVTYHYGRWVELDEAGWCWVPGYEWGPAWVSWRKSNDYVGWAPLPPEARWEVGVGISTWADTHYNIGPRHYSFCHSRDFGAPVIRGVILPRTRNVTIINYTTNITNITYNRDNGYVFNGGLDYDYIAPRCSHSLPALKLVQNTTNIFVNGNRGNVFINTQKGNTLYVAAPQRAESNWNVLTRQPVIAKTYKAPAVSRGWAGMDKDGTREKLLVKMRNENNGATPESQPARAFRPEAIAVVPKKIDPTAGRPGLLKASARRDDDGKQDGPSTLKKPLGRPAPPDLDKNDIAKDEKRPEPGTLKAPAVRPEISKQDDKPALLKKPTVRPGAPDDDAIRNPAQRPVVERPSDAKDDGGLRKKMAEKSEGEPKEPAAREIVKPRASEDERRASIEKQQRSNEVEKLQRKQAELENDDAEKARRSADAEKMQRKQVEAQRDSAESARKSAEAEKTLRKQAESQRDAADNARRQAAAADAQRRSAESEKMQRKQVESQRDAAESARRQAAAADAQRRAADSEKMLRKQAEAQRDSAENARRQQQAASMEKQRRSAEQDNARRASEDNARRAAAADSQRKMQAEMSRRASDESRQRQADAARQQAEMARRQASPVQRPQPQSSSNRQPSSEEIELLKKKKSR